jgi:uncharacterized membrane protein YkvA (DUF1232 family)
MLQRLRTWAALVKRDVVAVYLTARDPRVPLLTKLAAACVAAYALSPIDLIPDFIPILGYLDDLIIVPAGLWLVLRLIPPDILAEHRAAAAGRAKPASRAGAIVITALWTIALLAAAWWLYRRFGAT